jgi:signal transduction histidine kinase
MENSKQKNIHISALARDGMLELRVSDSGTGIPEELQRQIFDPFFTTKPPGKGTGLGLALCQRIVSLLGGHISCDSQQGKGTTFYVHIPVTTDLAHSLEVQTGS